MLGGSINGLGRYTGSKRPNLRRSGSPIQKFLDRVSSADKTGTFYVKILKNFLAGSREILFEGKKKKKSTKSGILVKWA